MSDKQPADDESRRAGAGDAGSSAAPPKLRDIRIGDVVWGTESQGVRCARCDHRFCSDDENWKDHSAVRRSNAGARLNRGDFGPTYGVYEHPDLELAEIMCPHCGALLTVELYLLGEPFRWTYRSLAVAAGHGYDPVGEYTADPGAWISF